MKSGCEFLISATGSAGLALSWLLLGSVGLAEPRVEHLEPVSLARGHRGRIVFVGTGIDRAIGVWTSLPTGKVKGSRTIKSESERTEVEIELGADCPPGLYGMRLATEDGLSNLQLFVVDDLVPQLKLDSPHKTFPVAVAGELRPAAFDRYPIEVQSGQRLTFEVASSRLGTDADPLVTIYDASRRKIIQRDNDPGLFFDCSFAHTFASAGVYTVEVRDSRYQGSPHWRYLLRMGNFSAAHVAIPSTVVPGQIAELRFPELAGESVRFEVPADLPLGGFYFGLRRPSDSCCSWIPLLGTQAPSAVEHEPNDTQEQATVTGSTPIWLHGVLAKAGDKDYFSLDLKPGQKLLFRAETRPLSSAADVQLVLFDPGGGEVQRVDDVSLPGGLSDEAAFTFNVGKEGKHRLLVQEMTGNGGPDFGYRIEVRPNIPRIQLTAEFSALTLPQNSYQMVPLTVVRSDYNGPITLSLVDAPSGLSLEPNTIAEGETSLYCKVKSTEATPTGVCSFTIAGEAKVGETRLRTLVSVQPLVDRQFINVDLQKHALRDNQRWLPPSVADRLALQVTPPAPFTVDLASNLLVLPRYQQAELAIAVSRSTGFDSPVTFSGEGGQVGEESQGRRQVFGRFPAAAKELPGITATFHSRSQANEAKDRVDILAASKQGSRNICFVRCLTLEVRPAFTMSLEPAQAMLLPGEKVKVKLLANRLPSFQGEVVVTPVAPQGITLPEMVTIPAGQPSAEIEVVVAPGSQPRRERIRFPAVANVGNFQEEPRPPEFDLEIKSPPTAK